MPKLIANGNYAQRALRHGASLLRRAVAPTLGPIGRTVLMQRRWAGTSLVSDGFTINRELELVDPLADLAVRFLEDASGKVRAACGDGTTTTVVLASGAGPMALGASIRQAAVRVEAEVRWMAEPVGDAAALRGVATLAAKDAELGQLIGDLVWELGADGAILVLDSPGRAVESESIEGFRFDRGALSPAFITDPARVEAVIENPYLLLTGQKLETVEDILPALERILPEARRLVVVAQDVSGEALAGLAMNTQRGNLEALAVQAPGLGGRQEERLEELAAAVGATVLPAADTGRLLAGITLRDLGRAEKVVATRQSTTVYGGAADQARVRQQVRRLRQAAAEAQTDKYRRELTERIGAIQGRMAVVRVGGHSKIEIQEKLVRARNAVAAAQAARRSGVLPGGGSALARAAMTLSGAAANEPGERDGMRVLRLALEAPLLTLAHNAGEHGPLVLARVREAPPETAYDAVSGRVVPAAGAGILDPLDTTLSSLQRAVSAATTMLTVSTAIVSPHEHGLANERPDVSARYE